MNSAIEPIMEVKLKSFFLNASQWQKEYNALRTIVLSCGLVEEWKWGWPCYTNQKINIVLMHGFKQYSGLLLMKGALIHDCHRVLVQQTENVRAARQIRFTSVVQIMEMKEILMAYILQAIDIERSGQRVEFKISTTQTVPDELHQALNSSNELSTAFFALTPGRQRGYLLYFNAAKQIKTRVSRIEKCTSRILQGKGLDDF